MSGLPYLRSLRKAGLVDIAEQTEFANPDDYNKNDLVVALDKHLRNNQSIFAGVEKLSDYYSRIDTPRKGYSPVKRESTRTPGRRSVKKDIAPAPELEPKEEFSEPEYAQKPVVVSPSVETPTVSRASARQSRQSLQQTPYQTPRIPALSAVEDVERPLPASPAVVTEVIDQQTTKLYESIQRVWGASGVVDHVHALRANLSSVKAVQTIVLLVEGITFLAARVPLRYLTTIPAIKYTNTPAVRMKVPDLFSILEGDFWVPLSVWFFTCFALPLIASYFINLSWKASTHGRRTRSTSTLAQFDPLVFNIAKALLVHLVLGKELTYGLVGRYTLRSVRSSVPGGEFGLFTGTAIGAIGAIYEAILNHA
ncbi:unnamed protein product [Penicillium olsonii]|uniref:Uncharacterized protein n=1 Tax=Penicillium olsonii TaxID=99116 RepID=A0A9W4N331_PENOL|nr:unnamed protein product [Penicillium olsonii]CAG8269071.1 unnamed protein product [Penicillium olsonii]